MAAKKTKAHKSSVEDRLSHLENIQRRHLDAHGETYPGALKDRAKLGDVTDAEGHDADSAGK
jgi:hypothetical protein